MRQHERRRIGGRQDLRLLLLLAIGWLLLTAQWAVADTASACRARNVVLVTLDGVRWQQVFDGIDAGIHRDPAARHRAPLLFMETRFKFRARSQYRTES